MSASPINVLLMVRELNIGGTERQCSEMAAALDPALFRSHVGCFHDQGFRAEELRRRHIPILRLPVCSFASLSTLKGAAMLRAYLRQHQIRIVHTYDSPMNLFGAPIARAARVPVVLTSQRQSRSLQPQAHRWLRLTDRLADGIVVNSKAVMDEMIREDKTPPHKLLLCYNGIDTAQFQTRDFSAPATESLTIGVLCALRPEKGLLTLIDAFHQVRHLHPNLRLVIVGTGVMRGPLEQRVRELNLGDQCHFEPSTSDVSAWLHRMDIFVLPSLSEALSNSLMEAMSCGCAPVASGVGGNPELVTHERTGLLFPPGDSKALASCLARLIRDPALRISLAQAAAAEVNQRFSLASGARRLEEIYLSFLSADR